MVFIGGWRSRRRRVRPQDDPRYRGGDDPGYQPGYGAPYGYGQRQRGGWFGGGAVGGGGGSCLRDLFLIEGGCCLAEMLGCGPQLLLLAPSLHRRRWQRDHTVPARTRHRGSFRDPVTAWVLGSIAAYQTQVSPHRASCCKFTPTCSHYATQAITTYGLGRGLLLTVRRVTRCRPGARPGADPVPSRVSGGTQPVCE